jgi:hypothetical protein
LSVRLAGHSDWTLRYRRGYMGGSAAPAPKNADPMMTLSSSILPKSDLPMRLTAIAAPGPSGTAHVTLGLEAAPCAMLEEKDGNVRDTLTYEVVIVDEKKAKVRSIGGLEGKLTLSPKADAGPPPDTVAYAILHDVDVVPGHFEFRVSATSGKLAKGVSAYLDVDVPDFGSAPIVLGSLVLGSAEGARVPIAPPPAPAPSAAPGRGRGLGSAPTPPPAPAAPRLPFAPTLDRVFATSDTLRVFVEGTARSPTGLAANLDIVDATGKVIASRTPSLTPGDPIRVADVVSLQSLASGAYILRVTLTGGGQKAVRETGFAVR